MDEAEYCNTVGMMYGGDLIALASPDSLRTRLPGYLVQVDCDQLARAGQVLNSSAGVLEATIHGAQLHVSLADAGQQERIKTRLSQAGIVVRHVENIQPSLEDIFLYMVRQRQTSATASSGE